jgi:putative addiction module component (TIGR02574 family)
MNARMDHLLDEALTLPIAERSAVVLALLDSIEGSNDASVSEAWRAEIKRRREALTSGSIQAVAWQAARKRLSAL